jgi:hypothetical protein
LTLVKQVDKPLMTLSEHQRHASQSRWAKPKARADQSQRLKEVWALAKAAKAKAKGPK